MREDVEDAGDRLMLWYHGLKPQDKQVLDSNGSAAHLIARRRELTSRLAKVNCELALFLAERLPNVPRNLYPPIDSVLIPLNHALEQRIARGEIHRAETDRLVDTIQRVKGYAIEVIGYPVAFADGIFDSALRQLARVRAAATKLSPATAARRRH